MMRDQVLGRWAARMFAHPSCVGHGKYIVCPSVDSVIVTSVVPLVQEAACTYVTRNVMRSCFGSAFGAARRRVHLSDRESTRLRLRAGERFERRWRVCYEWLTWQQVITDAANIIHILWSFTPNTDKNGSRSLFVIHFVFAIRIFEQ